MGKKVDLLVRAGYGHQATTVSGAASGLANDGAFAYGAGAQVMIDDKSGVRADYSHLDVSQAPMKLWTVSYVRKF